ncbi:MAG: glycosyltransferase family 4 protein [Candidatus Helarchaeota archaeon]
MEKKINVCFFTPRIYSLFNKYSKIRYGGIEVQLFQIINELSKKNRIKIHIITGDYFNKKFKIQKFNKINIFLALPLKLTLKNFLKRIIFSVLALIKIKPDIIIIRGAGIPSIINFIPFIFSKIFRIKFIFSIASNREVNKKIFKNFSGFIFKLILYNADYIVAQNNYQLFKLKEMKKRFINKITIIKNGFTIKKQENLHQKKYLLWVGRAIELKRGELFIKLAKEFLTEKFIMICQKDFINDNYWERLKTLAKKVNNIEFFEFIPFNKIDLFFLKSKIFINTSTYEGFPNTFIQALKNRTPIISLNVNPNNIFTKYKIGFFCNNNFSIMKKYVKLLLEDKNLYHLYSKNAFNYCIKNHNIEKIIKEWLDLINRIVSS